MPQSKNHNPKTKISLVVAMSRNRVIGRNNQLPWRMSDDLKRFKALTMNHAIIMGRKTFASMNSKPLPGRTNIVVSRQSDFDPSGALPARDVDEATALAAEADQAQHRANEVFIIGGQKVFEAALPVADRIYLTLIEANIEGDTHFPALDWDQWRLVSDEQHAADDRNEFDCRYKVYERIRAVK